MIGRECTHNMIIDEILAGESKTVEFKREIPEKSGKYIKSVVAFSNSTGGKLLIGIDDKTKEVVGIPTGKAFELIDKITNVISDSCSPQIIPDITLHTIQSKTIIIITVYPGKQRPYYVTALGKDKGTFVRTAGSSRCADFAQIRELEFEGTNRHFDQTYSVGHTVSEEQIQKLCDNMKEHALKACKTVQDKEQIRDITKGNLLSWGLLIEKGVELLPTNAFLLLTDNIFPQAKIQCAVFKGTTRNVFIDKREYTGTLQEQIEEAYQFVLRNINLNATITGLYRAERYELPIEGIRELICNAVIHRSYLDEGCIQVALFDDRLEVTSPGLLFAGLSIEDLKDGQSRPRNRGIASAFVAMNVIEQWGTGIPRILKMCEEYKLPEPEFLETGMNFRVNMFRKQLPQNENMLIKEEKLLIGEENMLIENRNMLIEKENLLIKDKNTPTKEDNLLIEEENMLIKKNKLLINNANQLINKMNTKITVKKNVTQLFEEYTNELVFGRTDIMQTTGLSISAAGNLIHKLSEEKLIITVKGKGKGKYKFNISI